LILFRIKLRLFIVTSFPSLAFASSLLMTPERERRS